MKKSDNKNKIINVALFISSTLTSILLLEISLQVVYLIRSGTWLSEDRAAFNIGYTAPVEDRRQYSLRSGYVNEELGIVVNDQGFRGSLPPSDSKMIVTLGDSVPFGAGVKDKETYPAVLGQLLKDEYTSSHKISALNAGVPSYNFRQAYDRLQYDVLNLYDMEAILAITVQAANDMSLLTQYRQDWSPDRTWADVRWHNSWNTPSYSAILHHLFLLTKPKKEQLQEKHESYSTTKMIQTLQSTLNNFEEFCSVNKIPIILMPVDMFYYQTKNISQNQQLKRWDEFQPYVRIWDEIAKEINHELLLSSERSDCVFFLDTRVILDNLDRGLMYHDLIHYSPRGNKIVAESLLKFMRRQNLLADSQ
ncbi:MAG: SGNH/GDSL hydrolase family protein [Symploca sp. SIO1B1]|nr:SGNH/GDSL hydrolase family protein [Symploca sp. SIO1B1]